MVQAKGLLIGELSQQVNLSKQTIRYYERIGLLDPPQRTNSGYRLYSNEEKERLEFIQKAKNFGLSLEEIKTLIELRTKGILPCASLERMLTQHLDDLDQHIAEMIALRQELASRHQQIKSALSNTHKINQKSSSGKICSFIEQDK